MWSFQRYPVKQVNEISAYEYDYIIVGGGPAGCAVASRLSEDADVNVLLLERGGVNDCWYTRVPLTSVANGKYMVRKPTVPGLGMAARDGSVITAETLGGNSRMNAMVYTRGASAYYHRWARSGYPDWDWTVVEPYFRKVEDMRTNALTTAGTRPGPVQIRQHNPVSGIYPFLQKAAHSVGLGVGTDLNQSNGPSLGYYNLDLTIDSSGYRHSAEVAYLPRDLVLRRRDSLHICTDAIVTRLDFLTAGNLASGVFVRSNHSQSHDEVYIKVRREIILSAGSICTPQILQLSGIGPEGLLKRHNIHVRQHLPGVGDGLSDHCGFPVFVNVAPQDTLHGMMHRSLQLIKQYLAFALFGSGWLKSSLDRAIFLNTAHIDLNTMAVSNEVSLPLDDCRDDIIPDVEIMIVPVNTRPDLHPHDSSITLQTCLNQPFSTGTVEINSTSPAVNPTICLPTLSDPRDKDVARKALRFSLHLAERFVKHSGYPHSARILAGPGADCSGWKDASDADLDEYISRNIDSMYHLTSSCRMGKRTDGGVVDTELRVHGVGNVRIADASVLPCIAAAHPMAAVYMVAERCADFIKAARKTECCS